jgi:hypothetical protein
MSGDQNTIGIIRFPTILVVLLMIEVVVWVFWCFSFVVMGEAVRLSASWKV